MAFDPIAFRGHGKERAVRAILPVHGNRTNGLGRTVARGSRRKRIQNHPKDPGGPKDSAVPRSFGWSLKVGIIHGRVFALSFAFP